MQAMRTGASTLVATVDLARASGEAVGRILPIAFRTGSPSITPAPLRKVRRGISHFFSWIIKLVLFRIKAVTERKTHCDLLDKDGGTIAVLLERLGGAIHDALVELVEFPAIGVSGHLAHQMFDNRILAIEQHCLQPSRALEALAGGQRAFGVDGLAAVLVAPAPERVEIL